MLYIEDEIKALLSNDHYPNVSEKTRERVSQLIADEAISVIADEQAELPKDSPLYPYYQDAQTFIRKAFNVDNLDLSQTSEASQKSSEDLAQEMVEIHSFSSDVAQLIAQGLKNRAEYHKMTLSINAGYGFVALLKASAIVSSHFDLDESKQNKPKM